MKLKIIFNLFCKQSQPFLNTTWVVIMLKLRFSCIQPVWSLLSCFTGVFSIFNTSIYSDETMFSTPTLRPDLETNRSRNSGVIVAAVTVSVALLLLIAFVLYFVMKQRKKRKKKPTYPRYVPGLEDLIDMQTQSLSGGIESRGNRDLLELGENACWYNMQTNFSSLSLV